MIPIAASIVAAVAFLWTGLAALAISEDSQNAGRCASEAGTLIVRQAGQRAWHAAKSGEQLAAGDLVVGFPGAAIDSEKGAVRLTMLGDLDRNSPFPVIENAVVVKSADGADLSFTLDRGRVDVVSQKQNGTAHIRLGIRDAIWDLTLDPLTRVAFETYGRWPRGARFSKDPNAKNSPTSSLIVLVLKGAVHVKHAGYETTMHAPPGPSMLQWDSVSGADESPTHLDRPPPWAQSEGENNAEATQKNAVIERFRQSLLAKGLDASLDEFLDSENKMDRALAVFVMGALDELPRLGKTLREAKHWDVWDNGVVALRHWIGRGPGQDQILYKGLMEKANYTPLAAETVLQLLHSFGDEELARPETYQALIDYLDHELLAIRGLAYWHLYRLVPGGRELGYNPLAPKAERDQAANKWRELVPPGTVPARTANEPKK
jgi:hypothetical protein